MNDRELAEIEIDDLSDDSFGSDLDLSFSEESQAADVELGIDIMSAPASASSVCSQQYQCPICEKLLKSASGFSNHIKVHKVSGKYNAKDHICKVASQVLVGVESSTERKPDSVSKAIIGARTKTRSQHSRLPTFLLECALNIVTDGINIVLDGIISCPYLAIPESMHGEAIIDVACKARSAYQQRKDEIQVSEDVKQIANIITFSLYSW
ncbi:uncharacterized protein [Ptychodera flava]|uniref:uncharacterized protein n=1 Tax=Ptychodera flava TaxID=63121 RepID=UPI00396A574C